MDSRCQLHNETAGTDIVKKIYKEWQFTLLETDLTFQEHKKGKAIQSIQMNFFQSYSRLSLAIFQQRVIRSSHCRT